MKRKEWRYWLGAVCVLAIAAGSVGCAGTPADAQKQEAKDEKNAGEEVNGGQAVGEETSAATESIGEEGTEETELITITVDDFMSYQQQNVVISMDNWEEYFELCDTREDDLDVFGDPTGEYKESRAIRIKDGMYCDYWQTDVKVEYTVLYDNYSNWYDAATGELTEQYCYPDQEETVTLGWDFPEATLFTYREYYVKPQNTGSEDVHNEDYSEIIEFEVNDVSGTIEALYHIPDEVWNVNEEGVRFIHVVRENGGWLEYYEDTRVLECFADTGEIYESEDGDLGLFVTFLEE